MRLDEMNNVKLWTLLCGLAWW